MKAVFDSSPLIAFFFELESPETLLLLRRLGFELMVPSAVFELEIVKEPSRHVLDRLVEQGALQVLNSIPQREVEAFQVRYPSMGRGESEAILWAKHLQDQVFESCCVLDEPAARKVAARLGVSVVGTIGLIRKLEDAALITTAEARRLFARLGASSFRADRKLLG